MRLYQIFPYGVGTSEIESFSSFLLRLATVHALSPNELLSVLQSRFGIEYMRIDERVRPDFVIPKLAHLVRPTVFTRALVKLVQMATGLSCLRETTLLALGSYFGRQKGVFRNDLAWCPLCLEEQRESGQSAHLQLVWSFQDYKACHAHNCKIVDRCPNCNSKQNTLRLRHSIDRCTVCGRSLVGAGVVMVNQRKSHDYADDLIGVVAGIGRSPASDLSQELARQCVDELFSEVWRREEERILWQMLPRDECIAIVTGDKELTLPILRRVAYRLGVDLYQILSGRLEPLTKALHPSWLMELPGNLRPLPKKRRICRKEFLGRVTDAREGFANPPTISDVARAAGTSTGAIEYHFPSLALDIESAHGLMLSAKRQREIELGRVALFEYLAADGLKSRKAAARHVASHSSLSKNKIRTLVAKHVPLGRPGIWEC